MNRFRPLQRLLGGRTALCVGVGVAIGSGIFRTPSIIAENLGAQSWIVAVWVGAGLFTLAAGLVTAELATRFPRAGGEYVYLREAYGDFAAFFFGWAYTVFIIGGGAATIAVALGEVASELLGAGARAVAPLAALSLMAITAVNCAGLRAGAATQNLLTALKVAALLLVAFLGFLHPVRPAAEAIPVASRAGVSFAACFIAAFVQALWAYSGSTDSAKLAEEVRDVHRAMPRALIGSALALTAVYVLLNLAFMRVMSPAEMAGTTFVANEVMRRVAGDAGERLLAVITLLVCLGALASVALATVRVTYALARDGLSFRWLATMSDRQAPIGSLLLTGAIAVAFTFHRGFQEVLSIYMFAGCILFSLTYASLIVFRRRERECPPHVFRCPAGPLLAELLIAAQAAMAWIIARDSPRDTLYTVALLAVIALMFVAWRRWHPRDAADR